MQIVMSTCHLLDLPSLLYRALTTQQMRYRLSRRSFHYVQQYLTASQGTLHWDPTSLFHYQIKARACPIYSTFLQYAQVALSLSESGVYLYHRNHQLY